MVHQCAVAGRAGKQKINRYCQYLNLQMAQAMKEAKKGEVKIGRRTIYLNKLRPGAKPFRLMIVT